MNNFQKRTAIRIAAVSLLLASIASPVAWFVTRERNGSGYPLQSMSFEAAMVIFNRLAQTDEQTARQLQEDRVRRHFEL